MTYDPACEVRGDPAMMQLPGRYGTQIAIIAIPAPYIFETIRDCTVKGVKAGLIITAGFSEARQDGTPSRVGEGRERTRELVGRHAVFTCLVYQPCGSVG